MFVDFVVSLAVGMDAGRNYDHYVDGDNQKIDEALGNTEWRERWKNNGRAAEEALPGVPSHRVCAQHAIARLPRSQTWTV